MDESYDITSVDSISRYAKRLEGRTLSQVVNELPENAYKKANKGGLGTMVEEYFFKYKPGPNKNHDPDFTEAGVELKVTGVLEKTPTDMSPSPYKAKERLVLTMISYVALVNESWETSTFLKKCRTMLLLFYLYEKSVAISDLKFVLPPLLWEFSENDLEIIAKDWLAIQEKVMKGLAHELSEGDTFYLSACRKGSGGAKEALREQPYSNTRAKARAFSLKPSYVNIMIYSAWASAEDDILVDTPEKARKGIEQLTLEKFAGLKGSSIQELEETYDMADQNMLSKSYFFTLTMRILGTKKKYIPEFEKADITVKTIRLQKNGNPKESMSFPAFKFKDILEQDWEQSSLNERLNHKFFFVVFQYDSNGILRFKKAMFWNMPYKDRLLAQQAWEKTQKAISDSAPQDFPKARTSEVVHVRPHGRNAQDTLKLPDGTLHTKQCFWLNAGYIADQIRD